MTGTTRCLLGLDVGERRIGVAVSDGTIAVPLTIIEHTSRVDDIARVLSLAAERDAEVIVVGLPVTTSGVEGEQARRTRRFGNQLAAQTNVAVVYQDELMSTLDAEAATAPDARPRKQHVDDRAAAIILQRYLDEQERS